MVAEKIKRPRGRPSKYTEEIAAEICARLAAGEGLKTICRDAHMPDEARVREWAIDDREGFSPRYARAREIQAERWADEIVAITDDAGAGSPTHEHIAHARLRMDGRKWLLSKLLPKKYGDALDLKHSGNLVVNVNRFPDET